MAFAQAVPAGGVIAVLGEDAEITDDRADRFGLSVGNSCGILSR
jgi:hypothetical protein